METEIPEKVGRRKWHFTHAELLEIISYDRETGTFTWLKTIHSRAIKGTEAGSISKKNGYVTIQIYGVPYKAHRLAWFYVHGVWPNKIDHKDRVKNNNIFHNLRDVTHAVNMQNQAKPHKGNKSGFIGVNFHAKSGKWAVVIRKKGVKKFHYGLFDDPKKASERYLELKAQLHEGYIPDK